MKNALKEISIFILLCLAVVMVLAVLLYNFNPSGKVVPSKLTYEVPSAIKEELQEATEASQTTIKMEDKIYTIDGTDLNVYQKNKSYSSGNTNPFLDPTKEKNEVTTNTTSTTNTTKASENGNTGSTANANTTNNNSPAPMSQTQINSDIANGSGSANTSGSTKTSEPTRTK